MKFIYKLFKQDPDSREGIIAVTSGMGIFVNIALALIKVFIGLIVSSIAIISEGVNSAADAMSALSALIGVGMEGRNDSFASVITILSSLIFLIFHVSVDAYAGILISLLIIKAGLEVLKDTISDILGRPGEHELAVQLYREIRKTDGIISAADMMLHNYGPDAWSGSVNVEIDHNKTVGEIYQFLHKLQLHIMHEYQVTMVFGVYAVDNEHAQIKELRRQIGEFVRKYEHLKSYHAVYMDEKDHKIYCDFIVDYKLQDWEALRETFTEYIAESYPEYEVELVIETEFI